MSQWTLRYTTVEDTSNYQTIIGDINENYYTVPSLELETSIRDLPNFYNISVTGINSESVYFRFGSSGTGWRFSHLLNKAHYLDELSDTSKIINMESMFYNCFNLIEVPNFNTINVKTMEGMFVNCHKLTSISNFDTSNVINMVHMFSDCYSLTNIPNFNTSNVLYTSWMFYNCRTNLKTAPNLNTIKIWQANNMYKNCCNLTGDINLYFPNVYDIKSIFENCFNIVSFSNICMPNISYSVNNAFMRCSNLITYPNLDFSQIVFAGETYQGCLNMNFGSSTIINADKLEYAYNMFSRSNIRNISLKNSSNLTNMVNMFYFSSLENVNEIDMSNVVNADWAFYECYNLKTLPKYLNTNNVTSMNLIFAREEQLTDIPYMNTNNVIYARSAFASNSIINIPKLNLFSLKQGWDMFGGSSYSNETLENIAYSIPNYNQLDYPDDAYSANYYNTKDLQYFGLTNNQIDYMVFTQGKILREKGWNVPRYVLENKPFEPVHPSNNIIKTQKIKVKQQDNSYQDIYIKTDINKIIMNGGNTFLYELKNTIPSMINNTVNAPIEPKPNLNNWTYQLEYTIGNNMTPIVHNIYEQETNKFGYPQLVTNYLNNISNITSLSIKGLDNIESLSRIFNNANISATLFQTKNLINTNNIISVAGMYEKCYNLINIYNFNTSNINYMDQMFDYCYNLVSIPNFDTSNVTSMMGTFRHCHNLKYIPNLNLFKLKYMHSTFSYCYNLTYIPDLNISNVNNMSIAFYRCNHLIDIPKLNMINISNMKDAFYYCNNLSANSIINITESLPNFSQQINQTDNTLSHIGFSSTQINQIPKQTALNAQRKGWNVPVYSYIINYTTVNNSTPTVYQFSETYDNYDTSNNLKVVRDYIDTISIRQIVNLRINHIDGQTTNLSNLFREGYNELNLQNLIELDNTYNVTDMSDMFYYCRNLTNICNFNTSNVRYMDGMFVNCNALTTIPNFDTSNVTTMSEMFFFCNNLTNVPNFNTSKVTNMHRMFLGSVDLVNIPNFNTSNVRDMSEMFAHCSSINTVPNFNTSNVWDMDGMFEDCRNLITVPNFDTSNVRDMSWMFASQARYYGYPFGSMKITNIPNFDTRNVTNMDGTFSGDYILTEIPLLNTSKVKTMSFMFGQCNNLTTIPNFNTFNVTNMSWMFNGCKNLTIVPNFNTSNVTDMKMMFDNCHNLTIVPNFNTSKVIDMSGMFSWCTNLTTVPNFNTSRVTNMSSMFYYCNNLSSNAYANIANMLPLATNLTNQYLSNIGLSVMNFTIEQILILNNKGYIDAVVDASPVYNIYYE